MSEINPDKVRALLDEYQSPNNTRKLRAVAPDIARAYLAKCEEVDSWRRVAEKLQEELSGCQKGFTAAKSLIKGFDESEVTYRAMYSKATRELNAAEQKIATVDSERAMNAELTEENQRLQSIIDKQREALEFYGDAFNYPVFGGGSPIGDDAGSKAQQALALTQQQTGGAV